MCFIAVVMCLGFMAVMFECVFGRLEADSGTAVLMSVWGMTLGLINVATGYEIRRRLGGMAVPRAIAIPFATLVMLCGLVIVGYAIGARDSWLPLVPVIKAMQVRRWLGGVGVLFTMAGVVILHRGTLKPTID